MTPNRHRIEGAARLASGDESDYFHGHRKAGPPLTAPRSVEAFGALNR